MRFAAAFLTLGFGALQSVALTDCCCLALCPRPETSCPAGHHDPAPSPPADCCGTPAPHEDAPPAKPCTHLEPSHDIVPHAADPLPVVSLTAPAEAAPEPPSLGPGAPSREAPAAEARGRPPLFILHRSLLR
ncbi:MAG TPA: hypothetical protein VNO22_03115 [Planctomycetota bacterium]|nr:hypothetical protein [Planctomycetota bacterium]